MNMHIWTTNDKNFGNWGVDTYETSLRDYLTNISRFSLNDFCLSVFF